MHDLIVVGFRGKHRASEVLVRLQELQYDWTIDLYDAVAAYRTDDGRLRVDQSVQFAANVGAGWGVLLDWMMGVALGARKAECRKRRLGVTDDFVREVVGMIQPGDSAVFALVRCVDSDVLSDRFQGYGGKVLRTTLPLQDVERIEATLQS